MPVKRTDPKSDTPFQARSRQRLANIKESERRGAFPVKGGKVDLTKKPDRPRDITKYE